MSLPLPNEGNERDDSDDVYSEDDSAMMKTMELRAAKRTKEGGINTTTTTDDDAIDFDRTLALGKLLEIYNFISYSFYITHTMNRIFRMAVHILRRGY